MRELEIEEAIPKPRQGAGTSSILHSPYWMFGGLFLAFSLLFIAAGTWWLGRGDWIFPEQGQSTATLISTPEDSWRAGQTFVARHAGLRAIEVNVPANVSGSEREQTLTLHLRDDLASETDLRSAEARVDAGGGWVRFPFDPIAGSAQEPYYFFIESPDEGSFALQYGSADAYYDGALYVNEKLVDGQLVFRTVYDRFNLARSLVREVGYTLLAGIAMMVVFVVPGLAVIAGFAPRTGHWIERLGLAGGISVALYPLFMLWTHLIHLQLGALYVWLPLVAGGGFLTWHYQVWRSPWRRLDANLRHWATSPSFWTDLVLVAFIAIAGLGRLLMVRNVAMPLWADSVQHTVIVQRIVESGGLFTSWEPYTPYESFSLHFGFHANIAAWIWASGMELAQSVLWGGQILNLMGVLALCPLAYRIGGTWATVFTLLVAGIWGQFPAYYTNWGRYPQLAGQIVLPVAGWWLWMALRDEELGRRQRVLYTLIGGMVAAGMALAYFRMAFHYMAFAAAAVLVSVPLWRRNLWRYILLPPLAGLIMGLLIAPWIAASVAGVASSPTTAESVAVATGPLLRFWQGVQGISIGWSGPQAAVVLLGTLIIVWLGSAAALPVVWLWLLVWLPILRATPLPGMGLIQEFTIQTSLYIPISLIWGIALGVLAQRLVSRRWWLSAIVAVVVMTVGIWRAPLLIDRIDREYDLATVPDRQAAAWIDENLPQDAVFLINGIIYTDGTTVIGGDAGWWLPILSGRQVTIPPQYALLLEDPIDPNYNQAVNDLVHQILAVSPVSPEGKRAICAFPKPISHVYVGQRRGMVSKPLPFPPDRPMLDPDILLQDPDYRLIYQRDRVMVFAFNRAVCS